MRLRGAVTAHLRLRSSSRPPRWAAADVASCSGGGRDFAGTDGIEHAGCSASAAKTWKTRRPPGVVVSRFSFQGLFGASWIQRGVAPDALGRVIAIDMTAGYVVAPIPLIIFGALVRPEMMFLGTTPLLVLTTVGVLYSKPVVAMT